MCCTCLLDLCAYMLARYSPHSHLNYTDISAAMLTCRYMHTQLISVHLEQMLLCKHVTRFVKRCFVLHTISMFTFDHRLMETAID